MKDNSHTSKASLKREAEHGTEHENSTQTNSYTQRDPKKVLEVLQKALKIADIVLDQITGVELFVEILNRYLCFSNCTGFLMVCLFAISLNFFQILVGHAKHFDISDQPHSDKHFEYRK
jgi:hypothetical protein